MATVYVTEFARQGLDSVGNLTDIPELPVVANQTVAIGAGSVQSNAFNALTTIIRVHTDAVCSVAFGTNPTASATTARMAANSTEYFVVPKGASYKIAVITNS